MVGGEDPGYGLQRRRPKRSGKFSRIIWEGMMGNKPYPTTRSGAIMPQGGTPQPDNRQVSKAASLPDKDND
jgi:hypothetical protein